MRILNFFIMEYLLIINDIVFKFFINNKPLNRATKNFNQPKYYYTYNR